MLTCPQGSLGASEDSRPVSLPGKLWHGATGGKQLPRALVCNPLATFLELDSGKGNVNIRHSNIEKKLPLCIFSLNRSNVRESFEDARTRIRARPDCTTVNLQAWPECLKFLLYLHSFGGQFLLFEIHH